MELNIEYLPVESLKPYEKNARKHQAKDVEAIVASIWEFGFADPIGIWGDGLIVEGHGRLLAAKKLGMAEVPCIRLDHLSDEQRRAYALAHNKTAELSEWDLPVLDEELAGISDIDMTAFGFDPLEPEVREDDYDPQPSEVPQTHPGDVFQLGRHRLMCGDSTSIHDVEILMDGAKADMLLTDPPYNVDVHEKAGSIVNDNMAADQFREFLRLAFNVGKLTLRRGGSFHIWHASTTAGEFFGALRDVGLSVRQVLIWIKNQSTLGRQDFQWQHEPCLAGDLEPNEVEDPDAALYGWKEGTHSWFKKRREKTLLYFDKPSASAKHPTMKPVRLFDYEMQCNTKAGDIVLDLFGGSGTTMIAAEQNGHCAYLMELDPKFCDVIIDRWETFTGEKAVKLN